MNFSTLAARLCAREQGSDDGSSSAVAESPGAAALLSARATDALRAVTAALMAFTCLSRTATVAWMSPASFSSCTCTQSVFSLPKDDDGNHQLALEVSLYRNDDPTHHIVAKHFRLGLQNEAVWLRRDT